MRIVVPLVGFLILYGIYYALQPMILSPFGFTSFFNQSTGLAMAAIGQTFVLLTGGIDLSLGSMVSLTNSIAGTLMGPDASAGQTLVVTVVVLGAGSLAGLFNGLIVTYGRIQPIIVTLSTSFVFQGLALLVRPQPGGGVSPGFSQALVGFDAVPHSAVLLLLVFLVSWVFLSRTNRGWSIYAIGSDERSAFSVGLKIPSTKVLVYVLSGLFASLTGLFLAAQTTSGDPNIGSVYTLNSVASAVLGGVALTGGSGGAFGPIIGAFFISIITNVLYVAGMSSFYQDLVQGGLLLLVLTIFGIRILRNRSWLGYIRGEG
jgi:ribose/xylose/arabinose/galactoside ABC-type transport system permease subunit